MTIKILFFDTSTLIKMFVSEQGSETVKWLTSSETKMRLSLAFVINRSVCYEFSKKIEKFAAPEIGKLSREKADHIHAAFSRHYKDKWFRVIGQKIISNTKPATSIGKVFSDLQMKLDKHNRDASIYHSVVNALACYGGSSHPILVTCDKRFATRVRSRGYRVINPAKQTRVEIQSILRV